MKFLDRVISEHSLKAISVMFESETFGPCLIQKLKSEGVGEGVSHGSLHRLPPKATPLYTLMIYLYLVEKVIYKWPYLYIET